MGDRFTSQVAEVINRNSFVNLALAQGYNVYLPVYDRGVDLILYRESDGDTRKVQLKSRWTIDRKYVGRDVCIAFPIAGQWYLAPHDSMVEMPEAAAFVASLSWTGKGQYHTAKPSKALLAACAPWRFGSVAAVAAKAENAS